MTVKVMLLNCGNHADDLVKVLSLGQHVTNLQRGEAVELAEKIDYSFGVIEHGGDETCREHDAMAVISEGPGIKLVRSSFNPSEFCAVDRIKTLAAALINEIDALPTDDHRVKAVAKTEVEGAAQWAVKAATAPDSA